MAQVQFKAKVVSVYNVDDTLAYKTIKIPAITRKHCDMDAMRKHSDKRISGFANSNMFEALIRSKIKTMLGERIIMDINPDNVTKYLDNTKLPESVTIDTSGFLAVVTINI